LKIPPSDAEFNFASNPKRLEHQPKSRSECQQEILDESAANFPYVYIITLPSASGDTQTTTALPSSIKNDLINDIYQPMYINPTTDPIRSNTKPIGTHRNPIRPGVGFMDTGNAG